MDRRVLGLGCAAALLLGVPSAQAQGTVKIGLINVLSGQFADAGIQLDNGVKTYMKQYGDTVAGKKIEIIRRDVGGPAPDVAKRLAQELVVREGVDILAGFLLTPNALAAADVSAQAKKFMVVMNAATSIITTKSPYMIRTSVTLPQVMETFGTWAAKGGTKKCYTMVTDYGPGHDSEAAFQRAFKEGGGEIVGSVRFPVANPDFSAFVQRAKDMNLECIYIFIPGGAQPAALGKAMAERGIDPTKTKILASGEATSEQALKSMGDAGLGIISAWHYDYKSDAPRNVEFVKLFNEMHGRNPDSIMVFVPGGAQPAALGKAISERGIDLNKIKVLGSGETTSEQALKSMGDASLGMITAWHYEYTDKAPKNVAFVRLFNEMHKRNPDFFSVGGYDGMHVIYEAVKKAGGKTDGDSLIAAAKGLKWDSPRGPMSIDPETRDVVQTIYIRKVEKVNGEPQNVAFDKVENVKDPVKARMPK